MKLKAIVAAMAIGLATAAPLIVSIPENTELKRILRVN